jgi:hypothetical protein
MKKVFHKITSMLIALVVLFSTMSFTITKHYCGDTLVDTSIFDKASTCGMEAQDTSASSDCSVLNIDCCNDEQIVVDGQDELRLSVDKISFEQQVFIASFVYTYSSLFEGLDNNVSSYEDYKPPLVIKQIYKFDETYLI